MSVCLCLQYVSFHHDEKLLTTNVEFVFYVKTVRNHSAIVQKSEISDCRPREPIVALKLRNLEIYLSISRHRSNPIRKFSVKRQLQLRSVDLNIQQIERNSNKTNTPIGDRHSQEKKDNNVFRSHKIENFTNRFDADRRVVTGQILCEK